jgi:hypothetical protein
MDNVIERAEIDRKLGELREQLRAAGLDLAKANQIQEKIGDQQKRKNKLLGITE